MKTELFKKLIKEAVREVLREELGLVNSKPVEPIKVEKKENFTNDNSINEMLSITKSSMKESDYRNVLSMDSSNSRNFNPLNDLLTSTRENSISSGYNEPGLDISTLDFVKKASAVYNKSIEIDKRK